MLRRFAVVLAALVVLMARPALAQQQAGPFDSCKKGLTIRASVEPVFAKDDPSKVIGQLLKGSPLNPVTIECDDTRIFANEIEWREAEEIAYARGSVVLMQSDLNVYADHAEIHRRTRNGTFYMARGTAHLTDGKVDKSLFGTLEPEVMFQAQKLEKIGPRTYRLTKGGFTTCAQPTPRWDMTGSSGTIVLDKRALLRNAVLRVKNVPIFYVPVIYYPLSEDDRSTGFLLPTYSTSSFKGTGLSNAFFWAIDRSQDATFYHDWYSKTGQGYKGEYRFVASPGSRGELSLFMLDEREQVNEVGNITREAHRSYDLRGHASIGLPRGFQLFGRTDYVTDITTKQLYQQNLAEASRRDRYIGATLNGNLGRYRVSSNVELRDAFLEDPRQDGTIDFRAYRQGRLPSVNISASEKPIGRSRLYFGVNGEMANLVSQEDLDNPATNHSLWRFDASPTFRFPLSKLTYLTATTSGSWRLTHWLESRDPVTPHLQRNVPLTRQLLDLRMNLTGPVLSRIFQTKENNYAERFKHLIEPNFSIRWLSPFDRGDEVVKFDGVDYEVGGTTTLNYSLANRVLAKRKRNGVPGDVRTILSVVIGQSYYTNALAARVDPNYQSPPTASKFSPLAIDVVGTPADHFSARFRTEIHPKFRSPQQFSLSSSYDTPRSQISAGWRKYYSLIDGPLGFENNVTSHSLYANTSFKLLQNRVGGSYGFDYDIRSQAFLQQRYIVYYNAQCCGISIDYQNSVINGIGLPNALKDRRFGLSFTLAGIGSFANPFGAFGDNSGRR
ncbi:MAG TPA: putative LPS assembly protein LptD [Vicinamibacterales bacterium]|nr:putative LPS assembly protein LptD [Vicinamibacterales bacterium]